MHLRHLVDPRRCWIFPRLGAVLRKGCPLVCRSFTVARADSLETRAGLFRIKHQKTSLARTRCVYFMRATFLVVIYLLRPMAAFQEEEQSKLRF